MTTVYQIIVDAYRQSNLIAIGVSPTNLQETEALRYLNRLVKSVFGYEAGDPLTGLALGANNISRPTAYPDDLTPSNDWFVPKNVRVNLNLTEPVSLYLHPNPNDGTRFASVDASNNLATYSVTVYGNGALIEGSPSITLNTNGLSREWFFRADRAEWVRYSPLTLFDSFPFPEEFDDFFILMLAFRLNPAYERTLDPQSQVMLNRAKSQFQARYTQEVPMRSELALIKMSKLAADRDQWDSLYGLDSPEQLFNKGYPW